MRYFIPKVSKFKSLDTYTLKTIKHIGKIYGHLFENNSIDADAILISCNDISCIYDLEKIRELYHDSIIIAGGHASVHFKLLSVFADIVWVGHVFEFFECLTLKEIINHKSCYTKSQDGKVIFSSQKIDWDLVPVIKVSSNGVFYWAGVGCKNKCSFCLTSWTNKHNINSLKNIKNACKAASYNKFNINIVSNEYHDDYNFGFKVKSHVKDMMIADVGSLEKKDVRMIRAGIEFCTEGNRKKFGKFFTDNQLFELIKRADKLKIELNLFCILGIENLEEWKHFFSKLPKYNNLTPRVIFKFTTLEILQHTPLYKKRFELFPKIIDNYFPKKELDKIHRDIMSINSMKYRTIPQASLNLMLYRTMLSLVKNQREFEIVKKYKDYLKKDTQNMIKLCYKFLETTDYQKELFINHKKMS